MKKKDIGVWGMSGTTTETASLFWTASRIWFIIIVTVISFEIVSGLRINEVELNPIGNDNTNAVIEWVELYSEDEIDLEGYELYNNKGESFNLSGSFRGYYVYENSRWLTNENQTIVLRKDGQVIDETDKLKDTANDGKTWNFCNGGWTFLDGTKGEENSCESRQEESEEPEEVEENVSETTAINNKTTNNTSSSQNKNISVKNNKIVLNTPKKEPIEYYSNRYYLKMSMFFAFLGLCVVLLIVYMIKRFR